MKKNIALKISSVFILLCIASALNGCAKKPEEAALDQGMQLFADSKYTEALAAFKKAAEINPDYAEAYYNIAVVYKKQGNLDAALKELNKVINMAPNFPQPYNLRGEMYANKNQTQKALSDFNKAVDISNSFGPAYVNLAKTYAYKGDYAKAYENAQKASAVGIDLPTFLAKDIEAKTHKKI